MNGLDDKKSVKIVLILKTWPDLSQLELPSQLTISGH